MRAAVLAVAGMWVDKEMTVSPSCSRRRETGSLVRGSNGNRNTLSIRPPLHAFSLSPFRSAGTQVWPGCLGCSQSMYSSRPSCETARREGERERERERERESFERQTRNAQTDTEWRKESAREKQGKHARTQTSSGAVHVVVVERADVAAGHLDPARLHHVVHCGRERVRGRACASVCVWCRGANKAEQQTHHRHHRHT
jgi:hypothetical protein